MDTIVRRLPGLASMLDRTFDVVVACECGHTFVGRTKNTDPCEDEILVAHEITCPECGATEEIFFGPTDANPIEIAAATAFGWLGPVIA